jgi:type VI secretion system protein ImpF
MSQDDDIKIRQPLLYALIDEDPDSASEARRPLRTQLEQVREAVRLDLQHLLNTRRRCRSWPRELAELEDSVLGYGVADVTGINLASAERRVKFLRQIGADIQRLDARFRDVVVSPVDNSDPHDRTLRFRVEATLRIETGQETAVFDFHMEPVSRRFE